MKENKGKEVVSEGDRPEAQTHIHPPAGDNRPEVPSRTHPFAGDKRKSLPKNLDMGSLPSRRDKRVKHRSSKVAKPNPSQPHPSVQIVDVDVSTPIETTPSKAPPRTIASVSSQPPPRVPLNIIENKDLAWERFKEAMKDEDINVCYDMSLKDFEHSGVHDFFKVHNFTLASSLLFRFYFFYFLFLST